MSRKKRCHLTATCERRGKTVSFDLSSSYINAASCLTSEIVGTILVDNYALPKVVGRDAGTM